MGPNQALKNPGKKGLVRMFWKIPKIPSLLTFFLSICVFKIHKCLSKDPKVATFVYDWHEIGETKGNTLKVKCSAANHRPEK